MQADKNCNSLLKGALTTALAKEYATTVTEAGGTLYQCVRSGIKELDSTIGIYATDAEAYTKFKDIFDKVF